MTNPITAELNKERYCLVNVPEFSIRHHVHEGLLKFTIELNVKTDQIENGGMAFLPISEGEWQIIGVAKDLTNDQWKDIIEEERYPMVIGYKNYEEEDDFFSLPYQSGHSWLTSLSATPDYLILKEVK